MGSPTVLADIHLFSDNLSAKFVNLMDLKNDVQLTFRPFPPKLRS